MATSRITKPYHRAVMNLNAIRPMSDAELRWDRAYGGLILVLFLVIPVLVGGVFVAMDNLRMGVIITLVSMGLGCALGWGVRQHILNSFFRVGDASGLVSLRDLASPQELSDLASHHALAVRCAFDVGSLTFIYNWLCARHVLAEGAPLMAYRLEGASLARWRGSGREGGVSYLVVPGDELSASGTGSERFLSEMPFVGALWLDSLVRPPEAEDQACPSKPCAADAAAESWDSKGRPLTR